MNAPLPEERPRDSFFEQLTAHDAAGSKESPSATPTGEIADLHEARECLELLGQLWPRGASNPATELSIPAAPTQASPVQLGRFEVIRELGRGGCGIVFLARDPLLNREVAVKVPRPEALFTPELRQRFLNEARAAAGLDHPNVVPVYEAGEDGVICYIASAYCPGTTLREWLKSQREPVPLRLVAELVAILAEAVDYTHSKGVLHRDLKPANILLAACGFAGRSAKPQAAEMTPKITDFGLAKVLHDEAEAKTRSGALMGTPQYMAPEQIKKELGEIGPHTDVYALGVILYEMLTGRAPFAGDSEFDLLNHVVADEPLGPSLLRPKIPRDLETICLKCLAKEPARRYASARALAEDLRHFLNGEPIRARPVGVLERRWRWCRKHPARTGLAVVSLFVLFVLLPGWLWYQINLSEARQGEQFAQDLAAAAKQAQAAAQETADTQAYFALLNRARERIATRPLGWTWDALDDLKKAAAIATASRDPVVLRTEAVSCLDGTDLRPGAILLKSFIANSLAFSPDGKYLVVTEQGSSWVWQNCSVRVLDMATGRVFRKLKFPTARIREDNRPAPDGVRSVVLSPDGKWLAVGTRGGWIHRWDLKRPGDEPSVSWRAAGDAVEFLIVSRDGRALFSCAKKDRAVKRWEVADPEQDPRIFEAKALLNGMALSPDGSVLACSCENRTEFLDPDTLRPQRPALPHSLPVLCYSPDGRFLAGWGSPRLLLLNAATGQLARSLPAAELDAAHEHVPDRLVFSPDGTLLISVCASEEDRHVKVWSMAGGRLQATLTVGSRGPLAAAPSPDGQTLAVAGEHRVALYNIARPGQTLHAPHTHALEGMTISTDDRWLACLVRADDAAGRSERFVTVWKSEGTQPVKRIPLPPVGDRLPALALHPTENALAVASDRGRVDVWDLARLDKPRVSVAMESYALRFGPKGSRLWAITDRKLCVRSWDWPGLGAATRWEHRVTSLGTGLEHLYSLATGQQWILAGGRDGTTRLLGARDGELAKALPALGSPVRAAALSPDESRAVLGSQRGQVWVVRVPEGKQIATLVPHQNHVTAVAFSGDGRLLATASLDHRIHLYLVRGETFRHLLTLPALGGVVALHLSADGTRLTFLARNDTAVRVWDLGQLHQRLRDLGLDDADWPR